MTAQAIETAIARAMDATRDPAEVRRSIAAAIATRAEQAGGAATVLSRIAEPGRAVVVARYVREIVRETDDEDRASMLTAAAAEVVILTGRTPTEHAGAQRVLADHLMPDDVRELRRIADARPHIYSSGTGDVRWQDGTARRRQWEASPSRDTLDASRCVVLDTEYSGSGWQLPMVVSARGLLVLELLGPWLSMGRI